MLGSEHAPGPGQRSHHGPSVDLHGYGTRNTGRGGPDRARTWTVRTVGGAQRGYCIPVLDSWLTSRIRVRRAGHRQDIATAMVDGLESAIGLVGPLDYVSSGAWDGCPAKGDLSPTGVGHHMVGRGQHARDGGADRIPALPDSTLPIEPSGRPVLSLDSLRH